MYFRHRCCQSKLEDEMFEVSQRAEVAGFYQWGLDVGHHQDNWDPYANLPSNLNRGDFGHDDDLLDIFYILLH